MKMNKEKFLKSELGSSMIECAKSWDNALKLMNNTDFCSKEFKVGNREAMWCQAQMEVYKMAVRQFYGIHYCFAHTDKCFGICTEDGTDWLFKIER